LWVKLSSPSLLPLAAAFTAAKGGSGNIGAFGASLRLAI